MVKDFGRKGDERMKKISYSKVLIYSTLAFITILAIFPLINLLAVSLTDSKFMPDVNGLTIIPKGFNLAVYKSLLTSPQVLRGFFNSILITVVGTFINVIGTSVTAYVLSRKNFIGRKVFMTLIIITMVFEPGIIPDYMVMKHLGLLDTYWAPILYKGINAYYLIIMIRYFEEIPESLIEAAKIDGANHLQIFFKIVLPMSKVAIASITLFYAVFHWNEYFRSMIYLTNPEKWPLQVVLREFIVGSDSSLTMGSNALMSASMIDINALKAGIIILTIVPVLFFYPVILKNFTKGTMNGAEK
jgi:putative aldouronate transport system permease protein